MGRDGIVERFRRVGWKEIQRTAGLDKLDSAGRFARMDRFDQRLKAAAPAFRFNDRLNRRDCKRLSITAARPVALLGSAVFTT